jgi:hypothetical protein
MDGLSPPSENDSASWRTQALMRSRPAGQMRPGTAGESFAGQQVRGSRLAGQAVPGAFGR